MKKTLPYLSCIIIFISCNSNTENDIAPVNAATNVPGVLNYTITNAYPHNISYFTEGLEWYDNDLFESTGDTDYLGNSKLARIDLKTGKAKQEINLDKKYFGEGMTILNDKIYMLTWKEEKCFVFDLKTFKKVGEFNYTGQGWGMTNDGKYLIMDDGSNNLYYRDPETFQVVKSVGVSDNNGPLGSINELEYVDGFIYANVFTTQYIVKIDPTTGNVVGRADFTGVLNKYAPGTYTDQQLATDAVLNGIAYDKIGKRFFVTGKFWPKVFEVKFN